MKVVSFPQQVLRGTKSIRSMKGPKPYLDAVQSSRTRLYCTQWTSFTCIGVRLSPCAVESCTARFKDESAVFITTDPISHDALALCAVVW